MSKSKSKSKSKNLTFPAQYWKPNFEIYTYYSGLFEHGQELLAVEMATPPQDGDEVAEELAGLRDMQRQLNENLNERDRRHVEIEWEIDHLSRRYQATLLVSADSYPKTWQLMNTMSDLTLVPVMHFKKNFARARPNQLDPTIEPLIEVPGHPAYPSGHAAQNFLIAHVLSEVIGDDAELIARVFAIARGVAVNREWAGLHYPSDTEAGEKLARDLLPTMKRVFKTPIQEAIVEWQELVPEQRSRRARQRVADTAPALQEGPYSQGWSGDDPYPDTHFRAHQWNLENVGQGGGKPGIDIRVRGAWEQLGIWPQSSTSGQSTGYGGTIAPVRVAMIDLAIDLGHPALKGRFDHEGARNLDYPNVPKPSRESDSRTIERYWEAFGSLSSAHAIACAGIIAADAKQVPQRDKAARGQAGAATEPGCLGIAPDCQIAPYRAMTLTEPVLEKRRILARAVLEAVTGRRLAESVRRNGARGRGGAALWTLAETQGARAQVLLFPLPLEPLPESEGHQDPLAVALAFAATKIPVIIPSGNRGTSSVSYLSVPSRHLEEPGSVSELATLLGLDRDAGLAIFELEGDEEQRLKELIYSMRTEAAAICVGACNDHGHRSRYSQYGDGLTLVAPSDDTLPFRPDHDGEREGGASAVTPRPQSIATTDLAGIGGYMQDESHYTLSDNEFGFGGTSAAAAQVTGVVALMLQANPKLGPMVVRQILVDTARVTDEKGRALLVSDSGATPAKPSPEFGHGLVDTTRAVEEALRKAGSASQA